MRRASRSLLGVTLIGLVLLSVIGCGPALTPSPTPSSESVATPSPPRSPSPTAPTQSGSGVSIDPELLGILPDAVDGLALTESPDAEAAALGDPLLGEVATALAAGLAIDPPTGEFVYAVVVRLLPGAMDDAAFRDWRDTFDEGACSQADGVEGHAQTDVDGRTVFITSCVGGLRTYHVWLQAAGLLISASAVGERRLGEQLVENLQPGSG